MRLIADQELYEKGGNKITAALGLGALSIYGFYEAVTQHNISEAVIAAPVLAFALYSAKRGVQEIRQSRQA